ncbi:sugar transferase [Cohnella phaseoli]|uniref:Lipopolysaccharide/colanic/teichoic acid biosynthesis glycosyltransferase n=1 Tax=Cohnella phaseoli TaxID=456490 RepID=A0A3D9KDZ3_9BACL|nr:sugar transferase [Cohnella phaseoli]RED84027.1 lipopolysaccharide/colanic/teichoic acid biosynthesis glycosyltransferase [Cohnella phaseoli]
MKRSFDIVVSFTFLLLTLPFLLIISLAIVINSKGGVLFKQNRVGIYGKEFPIYKFRSMIPDAESRGPYYTAKGDKRITRVGAFLRKTSLDELPQLINVLKGDMSLVGPRPDLQAQKEFYSDAEWEMRHRVRPGITGYAQATLRSDATIEQRKELDLNYVKECSFSFDIKIIFLTAKQVVKRGSY